MKVTVQLSDKTLVYTDVDSFFFSFADIEKPILIHAKGETTPLPHRDLIVSLKVEQ